MHSSPPYPLAGAKPAALAGIRGLAFDIDDTFTTGGRVTEQAYGALWALKRAGYALVPITGGPAGWCHHFARSWPVDAAIGENGGFTFYQDQAGRFQRLLTPSGMDEDERRRRLEALRQALLEQYPGLTFSADQAYRDFDLAIDYCQDVEPWSREKIDAVTALCLQHGAQARRSSIHINCWFGEFSKISGFRHWLAHQAEVNPESAIPFEHWAYIGDSLNDEPMFAEFEVSCGVANLADYLDEIAHKPDWITQQACGAGFAEFSDALLASKN